MLCKYERGPLGPGLFEQKVNVISAFPGTGKSTATMLLSGDKNYVIRDIDSAEFRETLKKKAGPISVDDTWYIYYVDYIQSMVKFYEQELKMNPEYEGKTVILFVASHAQVRDTLTKREMLYYYAVPTVSMFRRFILPAAAERIDVAKASGDEEKIGSTTRAYTFLAQQGESMINKVTEETAGNAYEQLVWLGVDVSDDEDNDDEPEYLYYFVHHNTFITNLINVDKKSVDDVKSCIIHGLIEILNKHPNEAEVFITPRAEFAVVTPRVRLEAFAQMFDICGIDFMTAANLASYGADHLVISRGDAQDLCDIIESVIDQFGNGQNDYQLWGEKSGAFERLYDNLHGMIYKIRLNIHELVDAQVAGKGYDGVYDFDSETEPAFGSTDGKEAPTATDEQLADAERMSDEEDE